MNFTQLGYFLLFIPLAAYIVWYVVRGWRSKPSMKVSTTAPFRKNTGSFRNWLMHIPFVLRIAALSLLIIALARPQSDEEWKERNVEGIDIMLVTDVSTSMLAQDLKPNRFEAAKSVALEFIDSRPNDNIGLTLFAGESFVQCPLTNSHDVLKSLLEATDLETIVRSMDDGTAIGSGVATAVSRLIDSKAKSKVVILLTDGVNNAGGITPEDAASMAKEYGIRVYTIGAATDAAKAPYPTPYGLATVDVEIDETTLKNIADVTGGLYFRATDSHSLKSIYDEIDKLERTKLQVSDFQEFEEEYQDFAFWAVIALLLELLLRYTILRRIP